MSAGFFMAKDQNQVNLFVNGAIYSGWQEVTITADIMSLARTFTVVATRSLSGKSLVVGIEPGSEVVVKIGDDVVLTGFVTKVVTEYDSGKISIKIDGASKTRNLEECTLPEGRPKAYLNQTYAQILGEVCKSFGIKVVDQAGFTNKVDFNLSVTGKVGSALGDFLRSNSLHLMDDENGNLVIAKTGSNGNSADILKFGVNVLSGTRTQDCSKRYRTYQVVGQPTNPFSELPVSSLSQIKKAEDKDFSAKERVCTYLLAGNATAKRMQDYVELLRDHAKAESDELVYTVQGWRQSNGKLWRENTAVVVKDEFLGIDGRYLIWKVAYKLSNGGGMTTNLLLKSKDAFLVTDGPEKSTKPNWDSVKAGSGMTGNTTWT